MATTQLPDSATHEEVQEFDVKIHVKKIGRCYGMELQLESGLWEQHVADIHFVFHSLATGIARYGSEITITEIPQKETPNGDGA